MIVPSGKYRSGCLVHSPTRAVEFIASGVGPVRKAEVEDIRIEGKEHGLIGASCREIRNICECLELIYG